MNVEKFIFPVTVSAAILGIYAFLRPRNDAPLQATTPNPASSGVTGPFTQLGAVQPVTYNVPAVSSQPLPLDVLRNPYHTNPGGSGSSTDNGQAPIYLTANFGPGADLSKQQPPLKSPDSCGCGCEEKKCSNSCNTKNAFPDGAGNTQLSSSRRRQAANSDMPEWFPGVLDNLLSWYASDNSREAPSLTNFPEDGSLESLGNIYKVTTSMQSL